MRNTEWISKFVDEGWDDAYAYTSRDIAELLQCDTRIARYYLMTMVRVGKLCQLKYRNRTYYIKPYQIEMFKKFKHIGLRIL